MDEYSFISQAKIKAARRRAKPAVSQDSSYWLERQASNWLRRASGQHESGRQLSLFTSEGSSMKTLTAVGLSLSINLALLGLFAAAAFGNFSNAQRGQVTVSEVESTYAYAPVASASLAVHQF
jgi:hypothetical protein